MHAREILLSLLVFCSVQLIFAQDEPLQTPRQLNLKKTYDDTLLSQYDMDEEVLKRCNERPFYHYEARKVGQGTLVVKVTHGMYQVIEMTYLVDNGEDDTAKLDATEFRRESDGRALLKARLPGKMEQAVVNDDQTSVLEAGESVNKHLPRLNGKYGKAKTSKEMGPNGLTQTEVMKWDMGEGSLELEISSDDSLVDGITFVVGDQNDKKQKRLKVKNVDLIRSEMTIELLESADDNEKTKVEEEDSAVQSLETSACSRGGRNLGPVNT